VSANSRLKPLPQSQAESSPVGAASAANGTFTPSAPVGAASAANSPIVLRANTLAKEYRLYASPRERFRALFTRRALHRSHWALKGVSFELQRGQCLGVIGDNGAGKSTLLKLLTGTIQPSSGSVWHAGRVTAILELGAGFHPDFSGRDNLYFGGSLIGIGAEQMARLEPEIIAFSELGEAMDRPVKTYSSGMVVRLAFALVTAVQPDVLIIDEALAVGDQHFQKKCTERIMAFRESGCAIVFCSHSSYHIRHMCDRALWLRDGQVVEQGETEAVMGAYEMHSRLREQALAPLQADGEPAADARRMPQTDAQGACLMAVTIDDLDGDRPALLASPDLVVRFTVRGRGDECPNLGFMIELAQGSGITSLATHEEGARPILQPDGTWQAVLTFPDLPLHSGEYVVSAYLFDETGLVLYDAWLQYQRFRFVSPTLMPGLVRLPHRWG